MKNLQLQNDLEKLLNYDYWSYTDITTDYYPELGYILDVKDRGYFYTDEKDRDLDDAEIMKILENKFEL